MPHFNFLHLLLISLLLAPKSLCTQVIITGTGKLLSENRTFQLGFFSIPINGDSSSSPASAYWYLGISYASVPTPTYVWVANRNSPINNTSSSSSPSLEIDAKGRLAVRDSPTAVVWESDNQEKGTQVRLLDTGNLVLLRDTVPIWQSFDYPTDTWLPGMNFTGHTSLTSWRTLFDPSPGLYSLRLNPLGFNEFQLVYNRTVSYWSTGNWTGESFSGVPEMTIPYIYKFHFVEPYTPAASFWYTEMSNLDSGMKPPLSRFQVDANGQLRQYTWSPQTQSWNMFWSQPEDRCRVYGLCGELGFCVDGPPKPCECLDGFQPKNADDWGSGDHSAGCHRDTAAGECRQKDDFEPVGALRYDGAAETLLIQGSKSSCEKSCLSNCSCVGYYYNQKSEVCKNLYGLPLNLKNISSESNFNGETLYFRVPKEGVSDKNVSKYIVLVCSIVGLILFLGIMTLVFLILTKRVRKKKRNKEEEDRGFLVSNLIVFSYKELESATKGFSDKLGHGGFGAVFRGELQDSSVVAVKRLERPGSGEKEFRAEVCTIGNIQHVNLVRLRGFCSENLHRLLVYDYMPNGPLSSYLGKNSQVLSWDVRFRIALATAKGIAYLHEGCRDCIIHCDIKPENILLDDEYVAKVSDFGLAKLVGRDFSRVLASMRGTWGYVAPEWISGLAITTKADVYSFGMTLLELIGGRRNVEAQQRSEINENYTHGDGEREKWFFPPWAAKQVIEGNASLIVDPRLNREYDVEEAKRMGMVAIWCIQDEEEMRPMMGSVVKMLEGVVEVGVPPPPKLIQALVAGESYQGIHIGPLSNVGSAAGCSDYNVGLSSAGSRSSFDFNGLNSQLL